MFEVLRGRFNLNKKNFYAIKRDDFVGACDSMWSSQWLLETLLRKFMFCDLLLTLKRLFWDKTFPVLKKTIKIINNKLKLFIKNKYHFINEKNAK